MKYRCVLLRAFFSGFLLTGFVLSVCAQQENPVSIQSINTSNPPATEQSSNRLQINGFGVGDYSFESSTDQNSFASSALAISLYKPITSRLSVFAQLATALEESSPFVSGNEAETKEESKLSTEIDNLQLRWITSMTGPEIIFGKFDSPMAIERDDAPVNYQATESFNFSFGRPAKFTGVQVHQVFSEHFEGWALLTNGWDNDPDTNRAKTIGAYGMWIPNHKVHLGVGDIYGSEQEETGRRSTTIGTVLIQPSQQLVFGGEANYGYEAAAGLEGENARWYGALGFLHYRFAPRWAATVRVEGFKDHDGARTGIRQTLKSITVSPQYIYSGGFYGLFRYLDRTSLRLPEVAVRLDLREDFSSEPAFAGEQEGAVKDRKFSAKLQIVFLF